MMNLDWLTRRVVAGILAVLAIAGIWSWQWLDYRRQIGEHRAEFHVLGETVLAAVEGATLRATRGGVFDPEELRDTLAQVRGEVHAARVTLLDAGGAAIAASGTPDVDASVSVVSFRKSFVPLARRGRRGGRVFEGLQPLPAHGIVLSLDYPTGALDERIDELRRRFLLTASSLSAAVIALATLLWLLGRSAELDARLRASRERVRALAYLERLGAGLAHETRNPLAVVRGFAERLVRDDLECDDVKNSARHIVEETDRTLARLDEFLLLSRPAAPRKRDVDMRELLVDLAELLAPDLESKDAGISVNGEAANVEADPEQTRRLFLNLLLNAVSALSHAGCIVVAIIDRGREVEVVVEDDGVGVPEPLRDTLFEPYVTGRPGGTGLGLAIARRIAVEQGWRLRYEPREPRGTRMVVAIPTT